MCNRVVLIFGVGIWFLSLFTYAYVKYGSPFHEFPYGDYPAAAIGEDKCFDFDGNPQECFLELDLNDPDVDHSVSFMVAAEANWNEPEFALVVKDGKLDIQMKDGVTMTESVALFLRLVNHSLPYWKENFCDCPTCLEEPTMGARLDFYGVW